MTDDRLITLLIAWQGREPFRRHILEELASAMRSAARALTSADAGNLRRLADRCDDAVKEMPDD